MSEKVTTREAIASKKLLGYERVKGQMDKQKNCVTMSLLELPIVAKNEDNLKMNKIENEKYHIKKAITGASL